ncbi:MAG: YncE family protein [Mongoliitalea sp.]
MKKFTSLVLSLWAAILLISCNPDGNEVPLGEFEKGGILIMNEGAFGSNDGEVSFYEFAQETARPNIFEAANNRPFAGLLQDMVEHNGHMYLVANTGKVEVVNAGDFKSVGAVEGLDISRSAIVTNNKLYISDWGPYDANFNSPESYIAVVDNVKGGSITTKIPVESRPEGLFVVNNQLLVASSAARKLSVINLSQDAVSRTLDITGRPSFFFEAGNNLYLYAHDASRVYFHEINKSDISIRTTITVNLTNATSSFTLDSENSVYIITSTGWPDYNDAIAKISLNNAVITNPEFFKGSGFYGIGYRQSAKEIYIGDNNGFQGNGSVIVVNELGQEVKTFTAGRGPSGFKFRE